MELTDTVGAAPYPVLAGNQLIIIAVVKLNLSREFPDGSY